MTIQNQNAKNVYSGNGSTTVFPYTFAMNNNHPEYIHVYITGEDGVARETTDFTVDVNAGNVVYPKPTSTAPALASGQKITLMREVPLQQLLALFNQGPFFSENIEQQLDEMEMQIQQLREAGERSLKTSVESTNFNAAIPLKPGKSFRINQEGTGFEVTEDPAVAMQAAQISATLATSAKQAAEEAQAVAEQSAAIAVTAAIKNYSSVAAMKSDRFVWAGVKAITSGYYSTNDGGGGNYIVRAKTAEDVEDGGSIHFLQHNLVAELIVENGTVNVRQFGAKGDGESEDSERVQAAIAIASTLVIPAGCYILHTVITKDMSIIISNNAILTTKDENPIFNISGCNISISGGTFYAGKNDDSRLFIYDAVSDLRAHGLITLNDCSGKITGIKSTHSKYGAVVLLENTKDVVIENCAFNNALFSAVQILDHCVNTIVKNNRFTNLRYYNNDYYCYAVCTSTRQRLYDFSQVVIPPERLIYENNFVFNSEDSGLDTHGARNVTIRDNVILETVCAITCYWDNARVKYASGWSMDNVLIENNYCKSTKSNKPNTDWRHPFVLLGAINTYTKYDTAVATHGMTVNYSNNTGSYDAFKNCVIRNNTFITETDYAYCIHFTNVASNVIVENNTFDCKTAYCVGGNHLINVAIRNNKSINYNNTKGIYFEHFIGEYKNNENILLVKTDTAGLFYSPDIMGSGYDSCSHCVNLGDTFLVSLGGVVTKRTCISSGLRAIDGYCPEQFKKFNVVLKGNVATMAKIDGVFKPNGFLLPWLRLKLIGTGETTGTLQIICRSLIDFESFSVTGYGSTLVDGTYEARLVFAEYQDLIPPPHTQTTAAINEQQI